MSDTVKLPNGADFIVRYNYSDKEAHGVIVLIVISAFSMVAVVSLLAGIAISAYNTRTSTNKHLFVKTHVAAYFICFLLSDFLQAIGSLMNATWVREHAVIFGETCTAQGVIKEIADVSSAFWTLVIAIHTFCLLVIEIKLRTFVLWTTLVGGWSAIFAIVISGPAVRETSNRGPFYAISGYWCWISTNYPADGFTLDYLLMFMAALIAFILYALIYLKLRGNMIIEGYHIRFVKVSAEDLAHWREKKFENESLQIAMRMWIYPMAYVILILPMSIVRFVSWGGHQVSLEATIFASAVFLLLGISNVTLFLTTRPVLPPKTMWKISTPTLVTVAIPTTSSHGPHYESYLDPYYGSFFAKQDQEAAQLTAIEEKFDIHRHSRDSEYSQHSAHSHQHHFSMPPVAYVRDRDRERDLKRHSDYSFDYDPHHFDDYERIQRPQHDGHDTHHTSMPAVNLPPRRWYG